jgi:hypothetical protein
LGAEVNNISQPCYFIDRQGNITIGSRHHFKNDRHGRKEIFYEDLFKEEDVELLRRSLADTTAKSIIENEAKDLRIKELEECLTELLHHCTTEDGVDVEAFEKAKQNAKQLLKTINEKG